MSLLLRDALLIHGRGCPRPALQGAALGQQLLWGPGAWGLSSGLFLLWLDQEEGSGSTARPCQQQEAVSLLT